MPHQNEIKTYEYALHILNKHSEKSQLSIWVGLLSYTDKWSVTQLRN